MVDDAKVSSLTVFLGFRIVRSAHGVPALISPACVEMLRDEGDSYPAALAAAGTDVDLARWVADARIRELVPRSAEAVRGPPPI